MGLCRGHTEQRECPSPADGWIRRNSHAWQGFAHRTRRRPAVVSPGTHLKRDRLINAGRVRACVHTGGLGAALGNDMKTNDRFERLWRVRRRHDHIDALLRPRASAWDLRFTRNDRVLVTRQFSDREAACADAETRLRELQRAGWNTHW